jgi:hypothetical protein
MQIAVCLCGGRNSHRFSGRCVNGRSRISGSFEVRHRWFVTPEIGRSSSTRRRRNANCRNVLEDAPFPRCARDATQHHARRVHNAGPLNTGGRAATPRPARRLQRRLTVVIARESPDPEGRSFFCFGDCQSEDLMRGVSGGRSASSGRWSQLPIQELVASAASADQSLPR